MALLKSSFSPSKTGGLFPHLKAPSKKKTAHCAVFLRLLIHSGLGTCEQIAEEFTEDAAAGIGVGLVDVSIAFGGAFNRLAVGGGNRGDNDDIVIIGAIGSTVVIAIAILVGIAAVAAILSIVCVEGDVNAEHGKDLVQIGNDGLDQSVKEAHNGGGILFRHNRDVVVGGVVGGVIVGNVVVGDVHFAVAAGLSCGRANRLRGGSYGLAADNAGSRCGNADATEHHDKRKYQCNNLLHLNHSFNGYYKARKTQCQAIFMQFF